MYLQFDVIEAIKNRKSVRTYTNQPIDKATLDRLETFISILYNPLGLKNIGVSIIQRNTGANTEKLGTYGVIKGAKSFFGLSLYDNPDSLIMGGYEMETLLLYATSLGLGTVWLGGTFNRTNFSNAVGLEPGYIMPAISPFGYPDKRRFTEKVMRKFAKSDTRKPWSEIFFCNNFNSPLTASTAGDYAQVLEMVRIAPSATNTQPWRILKIGDKYHLYGDFMPKTNSNESRWRYLDMGIAICHFDLTSKALGLRADFSKENPNVNTNYTYIATFRV